MQIEFNKRVTERQTAEQVRWLRRPNRRTAWECAQAFASRWSGDRAFSQVDLLAVIFVVVVLFLVLLPALAKPGINSKTIQCLYNHRQLCNAWRMYADDSSDRIPYAATSGSGGRAGNSVNFDVANPSDYNNFAWSGAHLNFNMGNRANWDPTVDMMLRPLWKYVKTATVFKCPSDQSVCPNANGALVPRILSVSMNLYLGGYCPGLAGGAGDDGGWSFAYPYRIYSEISDLGTFSPARAFVFTDHRPDEINWSNFATDMTGYSPSNPAAFNFADWPGFFHDGGAAISFADGHTELHRWTDARTTPPAMPNGIILDISSASPNNADIAWLQDHSTRPK